MPGQLTFGEVTLAEIHRRNVHYREWRRNSSDIAIINFTGRQISKNDIGMSSVSTASLARRNEHWWHRRHDIHTQQSHLRDAISNSIIGEASLSSLY